MSRFKPILVFAAVLLSSMVAFGASYTVDPAGTGDYPTIQAALTAASPGDTVQLSMGTFTGPGNRDVDFLGKAVTVRSQYGVPQYTTIDCEGTDIDPHRGFVFTTGEDSASVLEGVKIINGHNLYGGAINISDASPTIRNCILENNTARSGSSGYGGAIFGFNSGLTIEGCTFTSNYARLHGGGMYFEETSAPVVSHCIFDDNFAGYGHGGGICLELESSLTMQSCTFYSNTADSGSGLYSGEDCTADVENTVLAFGGSGGAVGCHATGGATLTCSDVYGNGGGDWTGCIAGQEMVGNNLSDDPRFCRPDMGVFTLHRTSPCLADSNPSCGLIGVRGPGCGPSSYNVSPDGLGSFPTIQAAVDIVWDGDTINLTDGTFTGEGNRDIDYLGKPITIRSQSGNAGSCIIDCEADSSDQHRGFTFSGAYYDTLSVLDGVTITGGYMPSGGGIHCHSQASAMIKNCVIRNNTAGHGGGATAAYNSSVFRACEFVGNLATDDIGGAGLCFFGSTSYAENCTFYDNTADSGSAMSCWGANPEVSNTVAAFNNGGEAFHCDATSPGAPVLACCNLYGNEGGDWTGCISGFVFFNANMSQDPRFCDAPTGDLTLHNTSPCAAANNPGCGQIGAHDVGCGPRVLVVNPAGTGDFPTIQDAIDAAWDGDVVELTDGVFTGTGNRDINMGSEAITLRSQGGDPENCVIDCEGSYEDPHRGIYLNDEDMEQSIEGITITGGWAEEQGGGIFAVESGVDIDNCVISDCAAGEDSVMLVQGFGGGMYLGTGCSGEVSGCVIARNGALHGGRGGGAYIYDGAAITFTNCTFVSNLADSGNSICVSSSTVGIDNCIIAYGEFGQAVGCDATSSATCTCTVSYLNDGGTWSGCLSGQFGINGNTYANPCFCNLDAGNYYIHNTSACAPANSGGCGLIGALPVGCGPSAYVVNPEGTGDFPTIQEALDILWPGDSVELTDGTFTGEGNRNVYVPSTPDITLRSQSGNPLACVIDCQADSTNPYYGLRLSGGVDSTTVVEGVTITNAWANAVKCIDGDPRFVGCRFENNSGDAAVLTLSSTSSFTDCVFSGNPGGGMYALQSKHKMYRCSFIGNSSESRGGALYITDGGFSAGLELTECEFIQNESGLIGGAVYFLGDSLRVSRCSFYSNSAELRGGAIATYAPYAFINRSTLAMNSASEGGGIDVGQDDHVILSNLIIAFSLEGEAVSGDASSTVTVDCSDFHGNAGGDWVGCIAGEYGIKGNISLDPYFCDLAVGDLTLDVVSPCAPANSPPGCGLIGSHDAVCDQASIPGDAPDIAAGLSLGPASPNPFVQSTTITYIIPGEAGRLRSSLKIYDAQGRCVRTLLDTPMAPGRHSAKWDGSDEKGHQVSSGVYFYRLESNGESMTRRVVFLK